MKDLSNYLIDPTVFRDHILKKYDIDAGDLEEYSMELATDPVYRDIVSKLNMDLSVYLYLLDSCEEKVKKHFSMYLNRHLHKANMTEKVVSHRHDVMASMQLLLCFLYTVQYYFL